MTDNPEHHNTTPNITLPCPRCKVVRAVYRDVQGYAGRDQSVLICAACGKVVVRGDGLVRDALDRAEAQIG